jgi:hypothetical protein
MVERRKYERFDLAVPVKIETLARTAKKRKFTLRTANVCAASASSEPSCAASRAEWPSASVKTT